MTFRTQFAVVFACCLLGAACGGSSNAGSGVGTVDQAYLDSSPSYDQLSLQVSTADATPPAAPSPAGNAPLAPPSGADATVSCPSPHLFGRTHELVNQINHHLNKQLHHIAEMIGKNAKAVANGYTFEDVSNNIDRKYTITKAANADGSATYTWSLTLQQVGSSSAPVTVFSGSSTVIGAQTAGAAALREVKGTATLDYTALSSVITTENAKGQITMTFDNISDPSKPAPGKKRQSTVTLTGFVPETAAGTTAPAPRTGSYAHVFEPEIGGSLSFNDAQSFAFDCQTSANANVTIVSRWYKGSDGAFHGRSDAKATNLPSPIAAGDVFLAATCASSATSTTPADGAWMRKVETSTGATDPNVPAQAGSEGSATCDAALGATLPSLTSNASDFSFPGSVGYVAFPNEW